MTVKNFIKFLAILFLGIGSVILNSCSEKNEIYVPSDINGELKIIKNRTFSKQNGETGIMFTFKDSMTNQMIGIESSIQNNILKSKLKFQNKNLKWIVLINFGSTGFCVT